MKRFALAIPVILLAALAGCDMDKHGDDHHGEMEHHGEMDHHDHAGGPALAHHENMWESVNTAVAVIYPTKGNSISGAITFTKAGENAVHVHGTVTGLEPNSTHAIHIHEFGDASSPDGSAAGGHFNPEGHKHGAPDAAEHHAGDLGNVQADASGTATIDLTEQGISIAGLKDPIIGRGVVIHAKADDMITQPTGNAGGRIGVGVIGIAKTPPAAK